MNLSSVRWLVLGALCLTLPLFVSIFSPFFLTGLLTSHAQGPGIQKFWAFAGGLGAGFSNGSVDEFYEANHLAVKAILGSFDAFYRQIDLYPDQIGVARNVAQVGAKTMGENMLRVFTEVATINWDGIRVQSPHSPLWALGG